MKTAWLFLSLCTISIVVTAQKNLDEYKASNGITYKAKDTVKLGRGSAPNGDFRYIQNMSLTANTVDPDKNNLPKNYSGSNAIVKKVTSWKRKGAEQFYLVLGVGQLNNYWMLIEDAIATCEIAACKDKEQATPAPDKYDQLKKLKALLDEGVITQEEYDKEKRKILGES